jgi:hypothetical protein
LLVLSPAGIFHAMFMDMDQVSISEIHVSHYLDPGSPALVSFGRALTKSFGSLALGALLLAIVQFLSFLLRQAKRVRYQ